MMKKTITLILSMALVLLSAVPALAAPAKDESIYAALDFDGSVQSVQAVNRFTDIPAGKPLTDFGAFRDVENLSTDTQPVTGDDRVTWDLGGDPPGEFYYQGTLDKPLPVNVELNYMLDGKYVEGGALGGKTGHITIGLDIRPNPDCDEALRKNIMVQASISLNSKKCRNIQADGATLVVMGGTINLSYTVLPGKDASYTLGMDAEDFSMGGITFNLVSYENALGDFQDNLDDLTDGFDTMADSMDDMAEGTGELKDGLSDMVGGLHDLDTGLSDLNGGTGEFAAGMDDFGNGLGGLQRGLSDLSSGSGKINGGLKDIDKNGASLLQGYQGIYQGLAAQADPGDPVLTAILAQFDELNAKLTIYTGGISTLADQYGSFHIGIAGLPRKIQEMRDGYGELRSGFGDIQSGIGDLADGMHTMYTETAGLPDDVQTLIDGQVEFRDGIIDAKDEARDKIDGYFPEKSGPPVSFTDERNTVRSVQYMLKTPEIEKAKKDAPKLEGDGDRQGFFQRLIALFK